MFGQFYKSFVYFNDHYRQTKNTIHPRRLTTFMCYITIISDFISLKRQTPLLITINNADGLPNRDSIIFGLLSPLIKLETP